MIPTTEAWGYVRAVHGYSTAPGVPDFSGFWDDLTFDVLVHYRGTGADEWKGVRSSYPRPYRADSPNRYFVTVEVGARVPIIADGRRLEFFVPWVPYVLPCKSTAQRDGGGSVRRVVLTGGAGSTTTTGGGGGVGNPGGGPPSGGVGPGGVA